MWSPTHVQVTVQKAKGLVAKGKHGTNDAFVTIALGKEKFQTSIKEKALKDVDWHEECELQIPTQGNTAEIVLTALHRNFIGVDEFLGAARIPLADFDVYERPKNRWYTLTSKPGKEKSKSRGELEVKVGFIVKAGSLTDLSKKEKHQSSMGQLSHMAHSVGGSLLSIGSLEKRKGLKKFAKSIGNKMPGGKRKAAAGAAAAGGLGVGATLATEAAYVGVGSRQVAGDADPGVVSDAADSDDDFTFDDLSHKSSGTSLNLHKEGKGGEAASKGLAQSPPAAADNMDEWEQKLYGRQAREPPAGAAAEPAERRSWEPSKAFLSSQPEEDEQQPAADVVVAVAAHNNVGSRYDAQNNVARRYDAPAAAAVVLAAAVVAAAPEPEEKESMLARKLKHFRKGKEAKQTDVNHHEDIIIGGEGNAKMSVRLSPEMVSKYKGKSKEDLIVLLEHQTKKMKDMEDYLDDLLLRVMETTPRILQNPYVSCKKV